MNDPTELSPDLALQQEERQFRLLVQSVTDYAIYMLSPQGRVTSWNPGAERFKGYKAEEIIGQHFGRFYTEEDRVRQVPEGALRTARDHGRFESEGKRVRKDGSQFWAHVVIDAIRDPDGQLIGFAKITKDVTEQREARRALEETREALFQSQKMEAIGQLTGGIAHDFNNLLTVILGGLESIGRQIPLLPESPAATRITRSRELAVVGVKRAATLTSRLLAFARQQALMPVHIDANKLVGGIAEILRRTLGEEIALETVVDGGLWSTYIDPHQLENALLNLAVNARDAMPQGGRLTIETTNASLDEAYVKSLPEIVAPGQYVLIAVSDTGSGMDASTLQRAFEPFFTTKPIGQGTGLGLSQVYGFIRQSAGHIKIYSEIGEGTTVKLYLPRDRGSAPEEALAVSAQSPRAIGAEWILVVEDDEVLRGYATDILRELGYRVLEAGNGAAALDALARNPEIDLLFTDVIMPGGLNGRQLVDQALKARPTLKVLFTTGYTRNAIVHQGRLDPDVNLIGKPYSFEQLAAKIRACLDADT
jgi:PAS domain S-box-containing protein